MQKLAAEIKKLVQNAKTVLIASHVDPDGDSIGSMLAMGMLLDELGLQVDYYAHDGVPKVYRFLANASLVRRVPTPNRVYDLLVAVDSSDLGRLGNDSLKDICRKIINIDHHPDNTNFGTINYVARASSTAELVFRLVKDLGLKINQAMAENLYVALITDTGNFRYENTSPYTLSMASELLAAGVKQHHITTHIYDNKSLASINILATALAGLRVSEDKKYAWVVVTNEMMEQANAKNEDLIGLVDHVRSIDGVEVAVLFREDANRIKVNFRSKEKINVSTIANHLGGGGHVRAAGAVLNDKLENVVKLVLAEVEKAIKAAKYLA